MRSNIYNELRKRYAFDWEGVFGVGLFISFIIIAGLITFFPPF